MKEAGVKAALSDGNSVLKEWEQPCQLNLLEVYDAVKQVKQSVNDYLTQLIDQEKSSTVKGQKEQFDVSDGEEDGGDSISGFINKVAMVSETQKSSEKRKGNYSNQGAKKRK